MSSWQVRVWDRRDMRQCVMNMVDRDTRHDTWTVTARGEEVSDLKEPMVDQHSDN